MTYPGSPLSLGLITTGEPADSSEIIIREQKGDVVWDLETILIVLLDLLVQRHQLCTCQLIPVNRGGSYEVLRPPFHKHH